MRHFASTYRITRFAYAALAGVLIQPGLVSALALGNIALQSSLGQPLRVIIPVALSDGETLNTSCLKLVRDPVDGTPQLMTGRVSVERNAANTRLIVTTPRPLDEPALRLSLQAGCGDTIRRDYVLLIDPQGTESSTMLASADLDEFKNYAAARRPTVAPRGAQRVAMTSSNPSPYPVSAPAPTTFKPIYPPEPIAVAQTQKTALATPLVELTVTPREPVALTTIHSSSGFIAEAAAASLTPMSIARSNTTAASAPTAMLRTREQVPDETLWTQTWPYAAVLLSIGSIALTAFVKRPLIVAPAWSASTVNDFSKSPMLTSAAANTFTEFGAMSNETPTAQRQVTHQRAIEVPIHEANLDALLEMPEVEADGIDEDAIRKAWATLATESATDIGTDSILKAIEAAERDMRIRPPEPTQTAMDNALDDDLLRDLTLRR